MDTHVEFVKKHIILVTLGIVLLNVVIMGFDIPLYSIIFVDAGLIFFLVNEYVFKARDE